MQLVSGKVEFDACQILLLWHTSFLVSLWTFQPTLVHVHERWVSPGSFIASLGILGGGSSWLGSGSVGSGSGRKGLHSTQMKPLSMARSVSSSVYRLLHRACCHLQTQEQMHRTSFMGALSYVTNIILYAERQRNRATNYHKPSTGRVPVSDWYPVSDRPNSTQPYIFKVEYHHMLHYDNERLS